jgi:predicted alpha/beta superfamily hydrolase
MVKYLITAIMLTLSTAAPAKPQQTIIPISAQALSHFDVSQRDINVDEQRRYRIFVAVPRQPAPAAGYPVLYMLDGNAQFPLALNGYRPENGAAPLIIAVGYQSDLAYITAERTRDYTPYSADPDFAQGGQAEAFYQFIQHDLKPWVESQYPIDVKRQTLSGHSFGGLFTLYTLFNHPAAFQRYVAASPSIWWGNGVVIPDRQTLINGSPQSVAITVGEYEEKPDPAAANRPVDPQRLKQLEKRRQVTKARALAQRLQAENVNVTFTLFPGKNHGGVVPDSVNNAVVIAAQ